MVIRAAVLWSCAVVALGLALAPGTAGAVGSPDTVVPAGSADPLYGLQRPGDTVRLSDEVQVTRWAHVQEEAPIRTAPLLGARPVGRLHFLTEDGLAEVYPVLEGSVDPAGRRWLRVRVPTRPHGTTGWIPEDTVGRMFVVRTRLVIDRSTLRAKLYKRGRRIWEARVGVGKAATPTPTGDFWIRERLRGLGNGTTYGPWAFGTSAYSNLSDWPGGGVVGIHGTNQPKLVPGRPSHGCVRMHNAKIRRLAQLMPIGTPVRVVG